MAFIQFDTIMDIQLGSMLDGPDGTTITIDQLLGRGGFGQVFAGLLPNGTRVAVKTVLTSALSGNEIKALRNEAFAAKDISHPNVVRVIHFNDGEEVSGLPPFLVMEFVEGENLRAIIDKHGTVNSKPSVDELREMYQQIVEGMQAVNATLVHRDLKPENILVDSASNRLKIADFGLSKLADAATRSETFKGWGTLPYQAPEVFEHGPNTFAMDVYSAGVTFFELATLTWPIQPASGDHSLFAWRNAHLHTPPKDLKFMRPDMPDDLVQLITLMLQKDPAQRPSSWQVVIDRLQKGMGTSAGGPDVSLLVQKATTTLLETTVQQSKERAERERRAERHALLEQAFREPIDVLKSLVEAFNDATDIGKLILTERNALSVEVRGTAQRARFDLRAQIIDDLNTQHNGIYRVIGMARIDPIPSVVRGLSRDQESFGGFNLGYKVQQEADRFGVWDLFRFEHNPLKRYRVHSGEPRWFAIELRDLPRQLQVLGAVDIYQHEQRTLDGSWFQLLLSYLL